MLKNAIIYSKCYIFKNANMETSYFTKIFYLKKESFACKEWTKKISKETKRQRKRLKKIRKNNIDKNKEEGGILCEAGAFYTVQSIF